MLAASPSRAAESSSAQSVPVSQPAAHKTLVVRADPQTGKLVRSVILSDKVLTPRMISAKPVSPESKTSAAKTSDVNAIVDQAARTHEIDPLLIHSIIKVESNYDAHAVSSKGAEGLMQLMPSTARMLGVNDSFDPQENIEAGVKYLKYLKDLYKDDRLALAAYNAGPGAVDKYKWIPPYKDTQNYVYQVGKRYGEARRAAEAAKPQPPAQMKPEATSQPEEKHPKLEQFVDENGRLHLRTTQ